MTRRAVAIFAVILATTVVACAPNTAPNPTTRSRPAVPPPSSTTPTLRPEQAALIVVDGWSVAALGTHELLVAGERVTLKPLTAEQIRTLSSDTLTLLASRLHSARRDWACDAGSCSAGNTTLVAEQLAEPALIPTFGEVYEASGVEHGVFAAALENPPAEPFGITAGSFISAPDSFPALKSDDELVVAAGLGTVFPFTPYWTQSDDAYFYYDLNFGASLTSEPPVELAELLNRGLSDASAANAIHLLHPSQLSLWTSLTTGCGSEVACTIEAPEVSSEELLSTTVELCYEGAPLGSAEVYQRIDTVRFPYRTHQLGAWGDTAVDPLALTVEEIDARLAAPHLTEATRLLRAGLHLWQLETTGDGLAPALRLVAPLAYVRELGPDETAEPVSAEEIITQLLPDYVSVCDTSNT